MVIKPVWIVIGAVTAFVLFIIFSKKVSGFQNPTGQTGQTGEADMKAQICEILNNTYNTSKFNFENMNKTDQKKAAIILVQVEAIKQQLTAQGCTSP
jgi:hypothetical protein